MPFKSKDQMEKIFAMEGRGELPKGTSEKWVHKTPNIGKLPKKVRGSGVFSNADLQRGYKRIG